MVLLDYPMRHLAACVMPKFDLTDLLTLSDEQRWDKLDGNQQDDIRAAHGQDKRGRHELSQDCGGEASPRDTDQLTQIKRTQINMNNLYKGAATVRVPLLPMERT